MDEKKDLMLDIRDLSVEYRTDEETVKAVNGVSLQIRRGKSLGLVGETGAGKTTTALAVLNLLPETTGVITGGIISVDGEEIIKRNGKSESVSAKTDSQMQKIRGEKVAMIFQDPMTALNPIFTVGDQIAEAVLLHQNCSRKEAVAKAEEMLELVGIPAGRKDDYPHQFSGGMKQRVVIAMALACNPSLLIADEPTTALDVTIQAQVLEMIKELRERFGTSVLMITHDLGIIAETCDEVSVMYAGSIVEHGNLEDVFDRTRHPYTQGLFNSLPNIQDRTARLKPIRGLMPDPANLPAGCAFADRCDYACDVCRSAKPAGKWLTDTHYVACVLYEDGADEDRLGKEKQE